MMGQVPVYHTGRMMKSENRALPFFLILAAEKGSAEFSRACPRDFRPFILTAFMVYLIPMNSQNGGIGMRDVKCVFFDIGYTLVDEDDVWTFRCREQAETEEARRLALSPSQIYGEIVRASIAYRPQYRTVIRKFGFSNPAPYRHSLEKLYPDTIPVLQSLSAKYRLGIIANQTEGLCNRLQSWGIFRYFSLVVSSWDYHIMKPDARLFQIAVDLSGCRPSETAMVGDRLDNDIFPAKALGMKTIWVKQGFGKFQTPKSAAYSPGIEIGRLSELLHIL